MRRWATDGQGKAGFTFAGFTFIEASMVLFLLMTVLGLALPSMQSSYQRHVLDQFTEQFIADYLYAQSLAIAQKSNYYSIQIVPDQHYYTIRNHHQTIKRVTYSQNLQVTSSYTSIPYHAVRFTSEGNLRVPGGTFTIHAKGISKKIVIQVTSGRIRTEMVNR